MKKFKLLDELVKAIGLTPQEVVKHWRDTGVIKSALFSKSQEKSRKKQSKQVFETLRRILSERAFLEPEEIEPNSSFTSLGIDSLGSVEITMTIEEKFGISIPDEDVKRLETVQDFVDYLIERNVQMK